MHYTATQLDSGATAMQNAVKDGQVSLRLPLDMKERMESYARLTGRNKSHVVMEAVGEYLAWRVPQIEDLQAAIRAADAGEFATDAEVDAAFARHAKAPPARAAARKAPAKAKATPRRGR
jgi:predicted transcriptional regulator